MCISVDTGTQGCLLDFVLVYRMPSERESIRPKGFASFSGGKRALSAGKKVTIEDFDFT